MSESRRTFALANKTTALNVQDATKTVINPKKKKGNKIMALKVNLYKNPNSNSRTYGKVYGRVENAEPMSIDDLAKHMAEHNTPFSKGVIKGILVDMVGCIRHLCLDGLPVKLDNLAIIKCQVQSAPADTYKDFNLQKNIKNIRLSAISTGEFTRAELTKIGKLEYTSLAESLRQSEDDGGEDDGEGGNG